jgi:pimeloyl-ACP methyl ester carboxylesterase
LNAWKTVKWTSLIILILFIAWILLFTGCMTFRIPDDQAVERFAKKGLVLKPSFVNVNGRQIHYMTVGSDTLPTLVFLHGSPSSWTSFESYMQSPELLQHCRMVSVDRPGFGYSGFGNAVSLEAQSRLLMPVMLEINNGKPIYLAGHSLGGPLVVKMAADAPGLFSGIMLISGSVDPELEPDESWRMLFEGSGLKFLLPGAFRPSNTELVHFKKDVQALESDFSRVTCAVYLVHGDKDSWVPPGNVDYALNKLVHADTVKTYMIKGGNHFIPFTRVKEVTVAMLDMISGQERR